MKRLKMVIITLAIALFAIFIGTDVNAMRFEYTQLNLSSEQNYNNMSIARRVIFFNETDKDYTLASLEFEKGVLFVSDSSMEINGLLRAGKAINLEVAPVTTNLSVGTHTDTVTATFTDGTKISMPVNLTIIEPKTVFTIPTVPQMEFVYDGTKKSLAFENLDLNNFDLIGEPSATEAGKYWALVGLKNPFTSKWEDGTTTSKWFRWEITKRTETLVGQSLSSNEGIELSNITLPENWSWDNPDTIIKLGDNTYYASYTPTDERNYNSVISEAVTVKGMEVFNINISTDSGISPLANNSYALNLGGNQAIKIDAMSDKFISSIKINGVEQLLNIVDTYTINVNNISEDIDIEVKSVNKTFLPIEGNSQIYIKDSGEKLLLKYDYDYSLFKLSTIKIDGNEISTGFEFSEGSVILTLDSTLLSTLELGKHNVEVALENGQTLVADFTIQEEVINTDNATTTDTTTNPQTNDNIAIYGILALISIAGLVILKIKKIKNKSKNTK